MFSYNGQNFEISIKGINRDLYEGKNKKPFYYDDEFNECYLNHSKQKMLNSFIKSFGRL